MGADARGKTTLHRRVIREAVLAYRQDDWRHNTFKVRRVRNAVREALDGDEAQTDRILELVKNQREY